MLIPLMRERLFTALEGTPKVLDALFGSLEPTSTTWDFRPDPDRFTLREVVAHLADYDEIFQNRIRQTRDEDSPTFAPSNPGQLAIDSNYAASDVAQSLARLRDHREAFVKYLRGLSVDDWQRSGTVSVAGDTGLVTAEELAAFVLVHDGYHTRQIAEWLALADRS